MEPTFLNKRSAFLLGIIGLLCVSCVTNSLPPAPKTQSNAYVLNPSFRVYKYHPDSLRVYFEFDNKEILYVRNGYEDNFRSNVVIQWHLGAEATEDVWDGSLEYGNIGDGKSFKDLVGYFDLAMPSEQNILTLQLIDRNRKSSTIRYFQIDPNNNYGAILLREKNSRKPIVSNEILTQDTLIFENPRDIEIEFNEIQFKYLHPLPVFYGKKELEDQFHLASITTVVPSDSLFVVSDTTQHVLIRSNDGDVLYSFSRIPLLKENGGDGASFGLPLRYISNREEYAALQASNFSQAALENFWLNLAGSKIKAKKLSGVYYDRVKFSNNQFGTFKPGSLTDRGMIFIAFGKPTNVYRRSTHETWVYGDENNMMALNFTFYLETIPPFGKDFILSRSPSYKNLWFRAVETWRSGRYTTF